MAVQNSRRNRTIDIIKYGNYKVTNNIIMNELKGGFTSYTSSELKKFRFNLRTLQYIQLLREYFNHPIHINGSWRTPSQNKQVGGVTNSAHLYNNKYGGAVDFSATTSPNKWKWLYIYFMQRMKELLKIKYLYLEVGRDGFAHIDDRDNGLGVQQSDGRLINGYKLSQIRALAIGAGGNSAEQTINIINKITKKKFKELLNNVKLENQKLYKLYKKGAKWLK